MHKGWPCCTHCRQKELALPCPCRGWRRDRLDRDAIAMAREVEREREKGGKQRDASKGRGADEASRSVAERGGMQPMRARSNLAAARQSGLDQYTALQSSPRWNSNRFALQIGPTHSPMQSRQSVRLERQAEEFPNFGRPSRRGHRLRSPSQPIAAHRQTTAVYDLDGRVKPCTWPQEPHARHPTPTRLHLVWMVRPSGSDSLVPNSLVPIATLCTIFLFLAQRERERERERRQGWDLVILGAKQNLGRGFGRGFGRAQRCKTVDKTTPGLLADCIITWPYFTFLGVALHRFALLHFAMSTARVIAAVMARRRRNRSSSRSNTAFEAFARLFPGNVNFYTDIAQIQSRIDALDDNQKPSESALRTYRRLVRLSLPVPMG